MFLHLLAYRHAGRASAAALATLLTLISVGAFAQGRQPAVADPVDTAATARCQHLSDRATPSANGPANGRLTATLPVRPSPRAACVRDILHGADRRGNVK
jgi:hypothetical protein